ncbi:MAG: 16S rRNA (adenine(1518)-N(6)/adenine(1519)-N(6))-dimethyltransferase RsmA [Bacteroidetes bacterium]|nr:16S rRNA (adenine(1518)-N(6)/adenine(1519)-N(6))-dimethyltransferase RsmA [Bacteroidota bacterium]
MIRPKKHLGQHFLRDENIAQKIVSYLNPDYPLVLEIGPGMGVLTKYILDIPAIDPYFMEVDREAVEYLKTNFPGISTRLIQGDFLNYDLSGFPPALENGTTASHDNATLPLPKFTVIGNFPYNISSQILFTALANRDRIPEVVGMFQKEVAERIASPPGNKSYGIISVLLQAFYDIDYLFTVDETVFYPPPKVKSAVIRLRRNTTEKLDCDEALFTKLVKTAFNQRRKTMRNSIRQMIPPASIQPGLSASSGFVAPSEWMTRQLDLRAERLSVDDFVRLAREISTFA